MMPIRLRLSVGPLLCLTILLGGGMVIGQNAHLSALSVSLSHARLSHSSLSFDWQLVNSSSEPLYVYATFIGGPAAVALTTQSGAIKVRTSLSTALPVGVNAYAAAKFLRIG